MVTEVKYTGLIENMIQTATHVDEWSVYFFSGSDKKKVKPKSLKEFGRFNYSRIKRFIRLPILVEINFVYNTHKYTNLSEKFFLERLKKNTKWTPADRILAGKFAELEHRCHCYDIKMLSKSEADKFFTIHREPDDSKSNEINLIKSDAIYKKLETAYKKLDSELYHSRDFNDELIEKIKYGTNYGILILCPQLFAGLLRNEADKEKLKSSLLNPEILHDPAKHIIIQKDSYPVYLDKYAFLVVNAQEKGALCKLLMDALAGDSASQMIILDSMTSPRTSETDIGPRPNDRYKYLEYLPDEVLENHEFLLHLIAKDHEVFHHLPKKQQEPIKQDLEIIFYESKDKEFFFNTFGYATDESKENFIIRYISDSSDLTRISKLPDLYLSIDILLKSIEKLKERKLNRGEESHAQQMLYTLAIDKVNAEKMETHEKDAAMYKIYLHSRENSQLELSDLAWGLLKSPKEFPA